MREPWFFAPPDQWAEAEVSLPPEESHHAAHVLRIAPPDVITVIDGRGTIARCAAGRYENARLLAEIVEIERRRPLRPELVIYQGAPKGHKADDVVEQLGALGVSELLVYSSERSIVRWDAPKVAKLEERWRSIARSAAKQTRNPFTMSATARVSWTELVRRIAKEPYAIVLWEEASLPLRTALGVRPDRVALVVGPEGGLARREAEELADMGAQLVSLGPRILRTEQAGVVAASAILFHYELIG